MAVFCGAEAGEIGNPDTFIPELNAVLEAVQQESQGNTHGLEDLKLPSLAATLSPRLLAIATALNTDLKTDNNLARSIGVCAHLGGVLHELTRFAAAATSDLSPERRAKLEEWYAFAVEDAEVKLKAMLETADRVVRWMVEGQTP